MTPLDWSIAAAAVAAIAAVNWFFLGPKGKPAVATAASPDGVVDVTVVVDGGYTPSTIEVPAGARVRMTLDRREDNPCSDAIVIGDLGIRRDLPAFTKTIVEFTAPPGTHPFTCGMGMLHGTIVSR
jgi:Cu+-exporting ATPase